MISGDKFTDEISELLACTESDLFVLLGEELSPRTKYLTGHDDGSDIAKRWLNDKKKEIQSRICNSRALRILMTDSQKYEAVVTVATICDLLAGAFSKSTLNVISVLVAKQGYQIFCKDFED